MFTTPRQSQCSRLLRAAACCLLLASASHAAATYPTPGGEGGKVITVNNLNDSGPGSFREALTTPGPRIIKFSVGGEIWLKDLVFVHEPFVTIDGASAPSPGISTMGDRIRFRTHDVIMRHVRMRVGALLENSDPQNRDAVQVDGSADGKEPGYNVLFENCSFAWAIDETVQVWGVGNHDVVIRDCLIAEPLNVSIHPKGVHSAAVIFGPGTKHMVLQRNLLADAQYRNPVVCGGAEALVVNNFIYNPGFGGLQIYMELTQGPTLVTAVGNVVQAGANTRSSLTIFHNQGVNPGSKVYYQDNLAVGTKAWDAHEVPPMRKGQTAAEPSPFVDAPPVPLGDIKPMPAKEVEEYVLTHAGARPQERDALDKRIIEEVRARKGKIRDWPTDPRLVPDLAPDEFRSPAAKP